MKPLKAAAFTVAKQIPNRACQGRAKLFPINAFAHTSGKAELEVPEIHENSDPLDIRLHQWRCLPKPGGATSPPGESLGSPDPDLRGRSEGL